MTNWEGKALKAFITGISLLTVFFLLLSACGYHFANRRSELSSEFRSVAIPFFDNDTADSSLEKIFTKAFRNEFIMNSNMSLVSAKRADLVLKGRIQGINTSVVSYRKPEVSIESRVTLSIFVQCKNPKNGRVVWQSAMSYYEEYTQNPDPIVTLENREKAIRTIANYLAEEVHERLAARF